MPLHWTIDSKEKLVIAIVDGDVTREDLDGYVRAMDGAGTLAYRKLFDASRGDTNMTPQDLLAIGVRLRECQTAGGTAGPLAIVISPDKAELASRVLGILAVADRAMRVFSEAEPARRWIDSLPSQATPPGVIG